MDAIELMKAECLRRLRENQKKINQSLSPLNETAIWWRPNPASNSMGNLVLHLCGNLTQYILSGLGGQEDHRERSKEFEAQGPIPTDVLLNKLNEVLSGVYSTIERVDKPEWLRVRPVQCYEESGISILIHVTEHLSYHTGQIVYYIKLKEGQDMQFYDNKKLEEKSL